MSIQSKHILIVEPKPYTQLILLLILRKFGYMVTTAGDLLSALGIIGSFKNTHRQVDILLTNIRMFDSSWDNESLSVPVFFDELDRSRNGLNVLIMKDAKPNQPKLQHFPNKDYIEFIDTPSTLEDLGLKIRRIFERKIIYGREQEKPVLQ